MVIVPLQVFELLLFVLGMLALAMNSSTYALLLMHGVVFEILPLRRKHI